MFAQLTPDCRVFLQAANPPDSVNRQEIGPWTSSTQEQHRPILPVAEDKKYSMNVFKGVNKSEGHSRGELGLSQTKTVDESRAHMATLLEQADKDLSSK